MRNKSFITVVVFLIATSLLSYGCGASRTVKGGAIGAGAGAVIGGVIGKATGNTARGAILGAVIGGMAGAAIGNYMDRQADEMKRDMKNAKIERVGEGIKITFESGILFDVNKSDLRPEAKTNIESLARILQKYEDTNILVAGHTDSTGTVEYNMGLSQRRAEAVANYAKSLGVVGTRFTTVGHGPNDPIAPNSTVDGRQQNRRVEIAIFANEKLKSAAERGEL
jgi:outer membrane protein OmpA-like peptidoglycan-associated protein